MKQIFNLLRKLKFSETRKFEAKMNPSIFWSKIAKVLVKTNNHIGNFNITMKAIES